MRIRLLIYVCIIWSSYTVLAAYHLQGNLQGFGVEVICADNSIECEDAIEDINGIAAGYGVENKI